LALWRGSWPDLHIHIGRDNRGAWFDWAERLGEGQSFFASAVARTGGGAWARLCQRFAPGEDHTDDKVKRTVAALAGEALRKSWDADHFSAERQAARGRQRRGWRKMGNPIDVLDKVDVNVWAGGIISLPMRVERDSVVDVRLLAPSTAVSHDKSAKRTLSATAHGISLFDQRGSPFKFAAKDEATWSRSALAKHAYSALLIAAWEKTMKASFFPPTASSSTPSATSDVILAPSYFGTKDNAAKIQSNRMLRTTAPEPNDPDWIMWSFLLEQFGTDSGRLFLCNIDQDEHWKRRLGKDVVFFRSALLAYLTRPQFTNYPWIREWETLLTISRSAHASQKIKATLRALRPFTESSKSVSLKLQHNARLSINGQLLHLGEPPEWSTTAALEGAGTDKGDAVEAAADPDVAMMMN